MLKNEMKQMVDSLSRTDKEYLVGYITQTLNLQNDLEARPARICEIMRGIVGDFVGARRNANLVWARTMVAYQLKLDGFSTGRIGKELGKDHSSVMHMTRKMQDALNFPKMYWDIMPIWNEFQKRIKDETHTGTI